MNAYDNATSPNKTRGGLKKCHDMFVTQTSNSQLNRFDQICPASITSMIWTLRCDGAIAPCIRRQSASAMSKTRPSASHSNRLFHLAGRLTLDRSSYGQKLTISSTNAFPETLESSWAAEELEHLINVTHMIGEYRLHFKHGEPFKPVSLRVHADPISIIARMLDMNPNSYTRINDYIHIGREMVSRVSTNGLY